MSTIAEDIYQNSGVTTIVVPGDPLTFAAGYTFLAELDAWGSVNGTTSFTNLGTISALRYAFHSSGNGHFTVRNGATGVIVAGDTAVWIEEDGGTAINRGKVTSFDWGYYFDNLVISFSLDNSGLISAKTPVAVVSDWTGGTITNSGLIRADGGRAILVATESGLVTRIVNKAGGVIKSLDPANYEAVAVDGPGAFHLTNAGRLEGTILGGDERDVLINRGVITRVVLLSDDNDLYQAFGTGRALEVFGGNGQDRLIGASRPDRFTGNADRDVLTGGGAADRFVYTDSGDSPVGPTHDLITDFSRGQHDKLVFDMPLTFTFRGTQALRPGHNDIRYQKQNPAGTANDKTMVYADTTGDGVPDLQVELKGLHNLMAGDFVI